MSPRVSVVMPVGPDLRFLGQAVTSVLWQRYAAWEAVIVDDATGSGDLLAAQAARDPRIRLLTNDTNVGDSVSANRAAAVARGDILARLDADDVAEPQHLGSLVAALDADPGLGVVGSAVSLIDEGDRMVGYRAMPRTDLDVRWTLLFHTPFFHSTVAVRREVFEAAGGYREDIRVSQDAYFWHQVLPLTRSANLVEPLVRYRINPRGLTATGPGADDPRGRTHPLREAEWSRLGLTYDLYGDHPALEISAFLRDEGIPVATRRMPAYRVVLTALDAFLRHARERWPDRGEDRHRLAVRTMAAMVAEPPLRPERRRRLHERCCAVDADAARAAGTRLLLGAPDESPPPARSARA